MKKEYFDVFYQIVQDKSIESKEKVKEKIIKKEKNSYYFLMLIQMYVLLIPFYSIVMNLILNGFSLFFDLNIKSENINMWSLILGVSLCILTHKVYAEKDYIEDKEMLKIKYFIIKNYLSGIIINENVYFILKELLLKLDYKKIKRKQFKKVLLKEIKYYEKYNKEKEKRFNKLKK